MELGTIEEIELIVGQIASNKIPPPNKAQSLVIIRQMVRMMRKIDDQAAMIKKMALEYISDQGQWIDETAKYKTLCDQIGAFLEFAWRDVPMINYAFDRLETAIAAWREMKG